MCRCEGGLWIQELSEIGQVPCGLGRSSLLLSAPVSSCKLFSPGLRQVLEGSRAQASQELVSQVPGTRLGVGQALWALDNELTSEK